MDGEAVSYGELARVFLRMSVTAFGGPAAHIALAEDTVVTHRRWLTREHFLDLIAAANLIPGPNSTELMIHIGLHLRGVPGALLSGLCFIGPAFLITLALSIFYVSSGALPEVAALFRGIQPVIVAVIASAGWRLLRSAMVGRTLWLLFGIAAALIIVTELPEVVVMLLAGLLHMAWLSRPGQGLSGFLMLGGLSALQGQVLQTLAAPTPIDIFFYFLRIGAVLFGSGYILVAYIQQDLVSSYGWLDAKQLLDAIAIGQTTPGPVLTTTTAIGMIVAGLPGALLATLGFVLPALFFVLISAPFLPRLRQSQPVRHFLAGVHAAVVAAILVTMLRQAQTALTDAAGQPWLPGIALCAFSLLALIRLRVNATWLILAGGVAGLLLVAAGQ